MKDIRIGKNDSNISLTKKEFKDDHRKSQSQSFFFDKKEGNPNEKNLFGTTELKNEKNIMLARAIRQVP